MKFVLLTAPSVLSWLLKQFDQVLPYLREKTPHVYYAYMKFVDYLGKKIHELNVGQETIDFMSSVAKFSF